MGFRYRARLFRTELAYFSPGAWAWRPRQEGRTRNTVVYADRFTPDDERRRAAEAGEEPGAIPFLKRFTVFNTNQCDGLPKEIAASIIPPPSGQIEPRAEALIVATG